MFEIGGVRLDVGCFLFVVSEDLSDAFCGHESKYLCLVVESEGPLAFSIIVSSIS